MQADFATIRRGRDRLSVFIATLGWSRATYVEFVTDERMETLLGCHERAFYYFGGVPREVLYDYVARHIIVLMCRWRLCCRRGKEAADGRASRRKRTHNLQSELSQLSRAWSSRQTALRGNPGEASTGGWQARGAASLALALISA